MKIYCKPYFDGTNKLTGLVLDMYTNTTDLELVDIGDIYETVGKQVPKMIDVIVDEEVVGQEQEKDEEGNLLYEIEYVQVLKDCVVEFDVQDESFLLRSIEEILTSTYWSGDFGITCDYGKCCEKVKEVVVKAENELLKDQIRESSATLSKSILDIASEVMAMKGGI